MTGKTPKVKKYTVLACNKEGRVIRTYSTGNKKVAESYAKDFQLANIVSRGKTIAVYIDGKKRTSV